MLRLDYKSFIIGDNKYRLGMASMMCHPEIFESKITAALQQKLMKDMKNVLHCMDFHEK